MVKIEVLTLCGLFLPAVLAVLTIVVWNPIHSILWLIGTFLVSGVVIFYYFNLGFTCSLLIIVYIGAIAVLFLFIIMMIPVKERPHFYFSWNKMWINVLAQFTIVASLFYYAFGTVGMDWSVGVSSDFWLSFANELDQQNILHYLPHGEIEGLTVSDLYQHDIAIYGVERYQNFAFLIMLVGLILLWVLVAAIVRCQDE